MSNPTVLVGINPSLIVQGQPVQLYANFTNGLGTDLTITEVRKVSPLAGVVIDGSESLIGRVIPAGSSLTLFWTAVLPQAYPNAINLTFSYAFLGTSAGTLYQVVPTQNPSVTVLPLTSADGNAVSEGRLAGYGSLFFNNSAQSGLL